MTTESSSQSVDIPDLLLSPLNLKFQGREVALSRGQTVLEALEQAGIEASSSCRAGACQCCLMRATDGTPPAAAQQGLKESLKKTNHFLACLCRPESELTCEPAYTVAFRDAVVIHEIYPIGHEVVEVCFLRPRHFEFVAGQFITLRRHDGLARSYSIASPSSERGSFRVHVRRVPGGGMSNWFHSEARPGDIMEAAGPKGDCQYYPGSPDEPLTLIGTGTGIAPLHAIVQDALAQGHRGPITIYHGALAEDRFYLVNEFMELASRFKQIHYIRCVLLGLASPSIKVGELQQIVTSELTDAKLRRVYLCGDPGLVRILKKKIFLAGVSLQRIHADPFVGTAQDF